MAGEPSKDDAALLERLNALKPSTVQLGQTQLPFDPLEADTDSPIHDLSTRFKGLGTSASVGTTGLHQGDLDSFINSGDEIEGLLSDLQSKIQNKSQELDNGEETNTLLKKTRGFLDSSSHYKDVESRRGHPSDLAVTEAKDDDQDSEDKDADDYLQRVLDELGAEYHNQVDTTEPLAAPIRTDTKTPPGKAAPTNNIESFTEQETLNQSASIFDLPSTPSALPPPPPQNPDESEPHAPELPSAPTFAPEESPIHITNNRHGTSWKNMDDLKPFWCCVCSDDAAVKCIDCDSELLYCLRCWREVHVEEGDAEERRHRRVKFERER
ncbi:hypothetical protein AJ79_08826 [Helicocarpus griseus UAMH5409]|uniref:Uncharacterized protein n=1 Tax=Helicocarpus griseus UAMH5409 TaxID=1447875 RepID=A0A2B7WGW1_9EURO|nr:hypothetical protein AJ79_08826 [Helicocarpus griseus UAMH5409]